MYLYEKGRIYLNDEGGNMIAEVTYTEDQPNVYIIDHTFVDPVLRGQGIASKLVAEVVLKARREGRKIIPLCPFAKREFENKSEYHDIWYGHEHHK
jgi:predicted GNAT family acetyltransferase